MGPKYQERAGNAILLDVRASGLTHYLGLSRGDRLDWKDAMKRVLSTRGIGGARRKKLHLLVSLVGKGAGLP